jgi:hypothetical protein
MREQIKGEKEMWPSEERERNIIEKQEDTINRGIIKKASEKRGV